jgi:hypothetical protein
LKFSSPSFTAFAALIAAAFALTAAAQAPQAAPGNAPPKPPRTYPAPTNLKVLPKTLTGQQVHDIMETWEGSLGVRCDNCHAADPKNLGPNGKPRLNFADDSKEDKDKARLMVKMTEDINKNYISMISDEKNSSEPKVTCGTCHRGHKEPEKFILPDDDGPRPPQTPPAGASPEHHD